MCNIWPTLDNACSVVYLAGLSECLHSKEVHRADHRLHSIRKQFNILSGETIQSAVLDLGLISIASLGPRASTKVESHANFTESQKVSQPIFFFAILNTEKLAKTIN